MMTLTLTVLLVPVAAPEETKDASSEYVAKLTAAEQTAEAQFKLAMWARKQGFNDVAEGHLRAAVHINPNLDAAQKSLGRSPRSGVWETKEERKDRLAREAALRAERGDWDRRLVELGVEGACAVRSLTEAGVSAVEAFAFDDLQQSKAAVKVFSNSGLGAATLSLLRQAVASRFPEVRQAAAKALSDRNPDHVLPPLVEWVRPIRSGKSMVLGVGEIWHWQQGSTMFVALPAPQRRVRPGVRRFVSASLNEDEPAVVEDQLAHAEFVRNNAVAALQSITGKTIGADFSAWRDALLQATDTHLSDRAESPQTMTAMYYQSDAMTVGLVSGLAQPDCLAAGTLVAAKRGLIPIDKVCVGELVLSRNTDTDETVYKPVLARTLRPRTPMRAISVGDETIHATVGHSFWKDDGGWVKAKDLSLGTTLGAENGRPSLAKIADNEEPQQAYNLVVADFGTYFVGKSRILVHDNTPIRDAPAKAK